MLENFQNWKKQTNMQIMNLEFSNKNISKDISILKRILIEKNTKVRYQSTDKQKENANEIDNSL